VLAARLRGDANSGADRIDALNRAIQALEQKVMEMHRAINGPSIPGRPSQHGNRGGAAAEEVFDNGFN
jgi:hypothetical protein